MRFPRGVVKKCNRYFARIHTKGGERSFPLGSDPDTAVAAFYRIQAELLEGRDPTPAIAAGLAGELTVKEAADRWISERIEVELEPRNAAVIRSRVERELVPFMGSRSIRSLRRPDCHAYRGHLHATRPGLKASTLHHYLRDLRELLNWAEEVELVDASPWPRRRILPRVEKQPPDRLADQEFEVLARIPGHWGFTLRFLLATGLRWGEACRARRGDIGNGHLLVRKAKSGAPRRVPLSKAILTEIVRMGGDWIVPRQRKAPGGRAERSSSSFNATIRRFAERHLGTLSAKERKALKGLSRFHVHQTRHTFACRYLEMGGELAMLSEILGHASIEMTQRYGRPNARAIRTDADRVFAGWEASDREGNREKSAILPHPGLHNKASTG